MAKILVVEDQPEIQIIISEPLKILNHDVTIVPNGKEAMKILQDQRFDLIVTDIIMPGMTGLTLIKEVRKLHPGTKVVGVSGGGRVSSEDYLKSAEHIGADITFQKPFDLNEFSAAVTKLLKNK